MTINEQLNQKQEEIHNLQMRLKKCVKEREALRNKIEPREYRYVVTQTLVEDVFFYAQNDDEAKQKILNQEWGEGNELDEFNNTITNETLFYCPPSGEGHEEVKT